MPVLDNDKLYQSIKELDLIPESQLDESLKLSQKQDTSLSQILLKKELISDDNLAKIISEISDVPFVDLTQTSIDPNVLKYVPRVVAAKQGIIPFKLDKQGLHLAMHDPSDLQILQFIKNKTSLPIIPYVATLADINSALIQYNPDIQSSFEEIISDYLKKAQHTSPTSENVPVIKIVDNILEYAYQNNASDVHIEPQEDQSLIRFRIDGILHDIITFPKSLHDGIISRIKVMSRLRTDEHQEAQDGKLVYKTSLENLDVRVSIVPITEGEKAVLRLLSETTRHFSLRDLGLADQDLAKVNDAYQKPYGMILATGPTGSGKTTTLYAILKLLNVRDINIMTIEDPVEYDIEGVNQIQVNPKTNLTFAKGLRSIVRQDPDVIFVGEIRDEETASIAVNSAMTGHLVLSSLHTNDAATTIPRLFDMEVEPFLIASTVNVIIAQRLVRKICQKCRVSKEISTKELGDHFSAPAIKAHFGSSKKTSVYHGKGCPVCNNTGYVGRVGIFEVMLIDDRLRDAIVNRKDAADIRKIAIKQGMVPMLDDGLKKVSEGITTIDEIIRVTKENK